MIESQPHSSLETTIRSLQDAADRGDLAPLNALLVADPGLINETAGPGVRTACKPSSRKIQKRFVAPSANIRRIRLMPKAGTRP
jgi:hypothetical protein